MSFFRLRPLLALCAIAAIIAVVAVDADARARVSFGSRGAKTFTAPPVTQTAPTPVRPIERTMTQPGTAGPSAAARPATPTGGLFGRPGFFGGLAAGFLGAGLIGLLLGHGLLGGLGGLASILGLLLQVGLVIIVARLLWSWWQRRNQPAFAGGPALREAMSSRSALGLGGSAGTGSSSASGADGIGTTKADFDQFERLLGEIQTAYGAEDLGALRTRVTPEMLSYFSEELSGLASRGVLKPVVEREAPAGRPRRSLARRQRRIRQRCDALFSGRRDRRSSQRPRHRRWTGRSHGGVDVHAFARRIVAVVGDPAGLSKKNNSTQHLKWPGSSRPSRFNRPSDSLRGNRCRRRATAR